MPRSLCTLCPRKRKVSSNCNPTTQTGVKRGARTKVDHSPRVVMVAALSPTLGASSLGGAIVTRRAETRAPLRAGSVERPVPPRDRARPSPLCEGPLQGDLKVLGAELPIFNMHPRTRKRTRLPGIARNTSFSNGSMHGAIHQQKNRRRGDAEAQESEFARTPAELRQKLPWSSFLVLAPASFTRVSQLPRAHFISDA